MTKKILLILLLITILGGCLRIYNLSSVPIALTGDEVAFGYNAFAILETGKDEHGSFLPLSFKSFGDYKPPIYVYILVPFIWFFGLTEFAVRFPAALAGTFLIPLVFLVSRYFFRNDFAALFSALLLAVSPWAINFSRGGFEAMVAVLFITIAFLLFVLGNKKTNYILSSLFLFLISMYTYHAQKIVAPLLLGSLFIQDHKKILEDKKVIILGILLVVVMISPLLVGLTNESGKSRARGALVTTYLENPLLKTHFDEDQATVHEDHTIITDLVFHPFLLLGFNDILTKVYAYFSPAQLFVYGDEVKRHGSEDFAALYLFEFVFILSGIVYLIRQRQGKNSRLLIIWLIVGLIPAMITRDRLHSIRSLSAIVPLYVIEGIGVFELINYASEFVKRKTLKNLPLYRMIGIGVLLSVISIFVMHYLVSYFIYSPIKRAADWQYGYKQMVMVISKEQDRFDHVVIDNPKAYGNPYVFLLFYQQIKPNVFLKTVNRQDDIKNKVSAVPSFGKYTFRELYWPEDRLKRKTLFVGTELSLPKQDVNEPDKMKIVDEIKDPSGDVVFRIVETY